VGEAVHSSQPLFGREPELDFITRELGFNRCINIVGEPRIGKTSLLNHLVGNWETHKPTRSERLPLLLATIDLRANVTDDKRFYGAVLTALLSDLPQVDQELQELRDKIKPQPDASNDERQPDASYVDFRDALIGLKKRIQVQPVLIIDDFERLLGSELSESFPYPQFFNNMGRLIEKSPEIEKLLVMVVTSRKPLGEYFKAQERSNALPPSFPAYFQPRTLKPLNPDKADALLRQRSHHPLTDAEVAQARKWAGGHPCHLQVAGSAWYEAKAEKHVPAKEWAQKRYDEMKAQNCPESGEQRGGWRWCSPLAAVGSFSYRLALAADKILVFTEEKFDETIRAIRGAVVLFLLVMVTIGVVQFRQIGEFLRALFGL
jgi:hypothetical protein